MPKLVWRVKLVAELEPGVATETEVGRFERGEAVAQPYSTEIAERPAAQAAGPVVVGLDGGYVRSRHRLEGFCQRSRQT